MYDDRLTLQDALKERIKFLRLETRLINLKNLQNNKTKKKKALTSGNTVRLLGERQRVLNGFEIGIVKIKKQQS